MATPSNTVLDTDSAGEPPLSFENALGELEAIVAAMEAGQMPLQESLDAYKRGSDLLRLCQATLAAADQQLKILDGDGLRDFDAVRDLPATDAKVDDAQEG